MNSNAVVVDKVTHEKAAQTGGNITLAKASVVELPISREQIKSMVARGEALVITTISGEVIVIEGFYTLHDGVSSDLVLNEGPEGLWKADSPGFTNAFSRIETIDPLLIYAESGLGALMLGSAAALLTAILASDSDAAPVPVPPPAPPADTTPPSASTTTLSINPVTANNIVNATEAAGTVAISGAVVGEFTPGDRVSFTLNGRSYSAVVAADGSWTVNVPGSDVAAATAIAATLVATDAAGNSGNITANRPYTVDTAAPNASSTTLTVNPVTADNILNATEAAGTVVISGAVTGEFAAGDRVSFTVNGRSYSAAVASDGSWTVNVPGADVAAATAIVASLVATDAAGNSGTITANRPYTVDTAAPNAASTTLTVNPVTADNIVNATEAAGTVVVGGTVTGEFTAGNLVRFSLNGRAYSAAISATGSWSTVVNGADLAAEADRSIDATLTATDAAGNAGIIATSRGYTVDTTAPTPTLTINPVTADNVVSAMEAAGQVLISGMVSGDSGVGGVVRISLNGQAYRATVNADGSWSVSVAGSDLSGDAARSIEARLTVADAAGNTAMANASQAYLVDTAGPDSNSTQLTINAVTADDVVNGAESAAMQTISGTVVGEFTAGDQVRFTLNGTQYSSAVAADGSWSVATVAGADLAAEAGRAINATLTATDSAGNSGSISAVRDYQVDLAGINALFVSPITADNVINASEAATTLTVSGTVVGDFQAGDSVRFTLNGTQYEAVVTPSGNWAVAVSGADLAAAGGMLSAELQTQDGAGNPITSTRVHQYGVDTATPAAGTTTLSVNNVASDDVLNSVEAAGPVTISGAVTGEFTPGDQVSFVLNGTTYTAAVSAVGGWSVVVAGADLAAATAINATLTATDAAGNAGTITSNRPYIVDIAGPSNGTTTLTINAVTTDNSLNAAEAVAEVAVSGQTTGEFTAGDRVSFALNGQTYSAALGVDGSWSVNVQGSDLAAEAGRAINATLIARDAAGNVGSVTASQAYIVDTTGPDSSTTSLSIDSITADNVVNGAEEYSGRTVVSGTVVGQFTAGDLVRFALNGSQYSAVVAANGAWSVSVAGADLGDHAPLPEMAGAVTQALLNATVTATDAAGNTGTVSGSRTYNVDLEGVNRLVVNSITSDNILNAAEAGGLVSVSGTSVGEFRVGDLVLFTLNGSQYSAALAADGRWAMNVLGSDLVAANGSFTASLQTQDAAGNPISVSRIRDYDVDTAGPNSGDTTLAINSVTADNILNAAEAGGSVTVSGAVTGEFTAGNLVSFTLNGTAYSAAVSAAGGWSVQVAGTDLAAASTINATLAATDALGNAGSISANRSYTVDTAGPNATTTTLTIGSVTADNVLNVAEAAGSVLVRGSVTGEFTPGNTVSFALNGQTYTAAVDADGNWSTVVSGVDLGAATAINATLAATDANGNAGSITATRSYTVDVAGPDSTTTTLSVDPITPDSVINAAEADGRVTITGQANGEFTTGDVVRFTLSGTQYTTNVAADGRWAVDVAGSDLVNHPGLTVDATLTATDAAGNSGDIVASPAVAYTVDTQVAATLTIANVTDDNRLSAAEAAGSVLVNGTVSGEFTAGDRVRFTLNATAYSAVVDASGNWAVAVAGTDLRDHAGATIDATLTATDASGNSGTAMASQTYVVAVAPPVATLSVNDITANNIVSAVESQGLIAVSGASTGARAGDTVRFTLNGNSYSTMVDGNGNWTVDVLGADLIAAGQGNQTLNAALTATDADGNSAEALDNHGYAVDTLPPDANSTTLTVDPVPGSGGGIVNEVDYAGQVAVSGTVTGTFTAGDVVRFSLNGNAYMAVVDAQGLWTVQVSGLDLADYTPPPAMLGGSSDGTINATLTATDEAGNTGTVSDTQTYTVDIEGVARLAVNSVTMDNVLNAAESGATVAISGNVIFDEELQPGATVALDINGTAYNAVVAMDGTWSVPNVAGADLLAANGSFTATLTALDLANNAVNANRTRTYAIDIDAPVATLTINPVTTDNQLSAAEAAADVTLSGTVTGTFTAGDQVTLTLVNDSAVTSMFTATVNASGGWSVAVPGSALAGDADLTVAGSVALTDAAGNPGTAMATRTYTLPPLVPTFDTFVLDVLAADDTTGAATATGTNTDNVTSNTSPRVTGTITGLSARDVGDAMAGNLVATIFADRDNDGVFSAGSDQLLVDNVGLFFANAAAQTSGNASLRLTGASNNNIDLPLLANGNYVLRAVLVNSEGQSAPGLLDGNANASLRITTTANNDGLGWEVTSAGDFNGDGVEDFLVSAPHTQAGLNAAGQSDIYLLYGNVNGINPNSVYNLTPQLGMHITLSGNVGTSGEFVVQGQSLRGIGDINGDGFDDFAMATNMNDRLYVVFGRDNSNPATALGALDLVTLDANSTRGDRGFVIRSRDSAFFGSAVSGGDLNNDGYSDLIFGDINGGANASGSYYVLNGRAGAGDSTVWNNMGAFRPAQGGLVYGGNDLGTTNGTVVPDHVQIVNSRGETDLGHASAVVGDVNGDGINDYIVNAGLDQATTGGIFQQGVVYVVFGGTAGLPNNFDIRTLTTSQGVRLFGTENREILAGTSREGSLNGQQGDGIFAQHSSIRGIGDVNGDGIADIAVGSPYWGEPGSYVLNAQGRVYVVYGRADGNWADVPLSSLNGTNGFILRSYNNTNTSDGQVGFSISAGGDLNGDGVDDFLIGAPGLDPGAANSDRGSVFIVFGRAGGDFFTAAGQTIAQATANNGINLDALVANGAAMRFNGVTNNEYTGTGVATGDWNGDGIAEYAYGRWEADNVQGTGLMNDGTFVVGEVTLTGVTMGTAGDDTQAGTAGVDRIAGGQGNDTITNIGADNTGSTALNVQHDVALGGAGNDLIGLVGATFTRVDGGLGNDTLQLDAGGLTIDLIQMGQRVQGFEQFNLGSSGTLRLRMADVLNQADSLGATGLMSVSGSGTSQVDLADEGWSNTGTTQVIGGLTYDVWNHTDTDRNGDLLIQQGLSVI